MNISVPGPLISLTSAIACLRIWAVWTLSPESRAGQLLRLKISRLRPFLRPTGRKAARARGAPMVVGLGPLSWHGQPPVLALVDGDAGRVIFDPEPETIRLFELRM